MVELVVDEECGQWVDLERWRGVEAEIVGVGREEEGAIRVIGLEDR